MAPIAKLTPDQIKTLQAKGFTPNELLLYLSQIQSHQPVSFEYGDKFLIISPHDAWGLISTWITDTGENYSLLERGSLTAKVKHLTTSIKAHQQNKRTAAASQQALRESLSQDKLADQSLNSFQQALADRDSFYKAYNDQLLNPTSSKIADLPYLKRIIPDKYLRTLLAHQLIANWSNYLQPNNPALTSLTPAQAKEISTANNLNEISHLIRLTHQKDKGPITELIHSNEGEQEIEDILNIIKQDVRARYTKNGVYDRQRALKDTDKYANFTLLGSTLSTISQNLHSNDGVASLDSTELSRLDQALRRNIISVSHNKYGHLSTDEVIENTLNEIGVPPVSFAHLTKELSKLSSQIQSTQIAIRAKYLGENLFSKNNTRLLATNNLAREAGVNPDIPWLKLSDLDRAQSILLSNYDTTSLTEAIKLEQSSSNPNPLRLTQLLDLHDRHTSYDLYQHARDNTPGFAFRDAIAHFSGTTRSITQPYRNFTTKLWGQYDKIDSIIHYPQRKLLNTWQDAIDGKFQFRGKIHNIPTIIRVGKTNIPLLNLPGFAVNQFIKLKKGLSLRVFRFAKSGTRPNNFLWRGVANYSKAFFKSGGNFSQTNFFMFNKARGNLLNWASKKATNKSWGALKATFGAKLWSGFSKVAPGLAQKFAGTAIQKTITSLSLAGLSGGTSIFIQAGFAVVSLGLKNTWKFITNKGGFRDRTINLAPIIAGIATIPAMLSAGVGVVGLAISGMISAFGVAIASVPALIVTALAIAFGSVFVFLLLLNTVIKLPMDIDTPIPGQLFTSIFCDESGSGTDPVANCATCLVQYLTECYGTQVDSSDFTTSGIGCLIAQKVAPEVASAIEASATKYDDLQCIGFARAAVICGGGSLEGRAVAAGYIDDAPPGFQYISGHKGIKAGDLGLIDGEIGHIFVVGNPDNGALVTAIDANNKPACGSWGCVSAESPILKSNITGYLRKN